MTSQAIQDQLKTVQTLNTISFISAPVSLLIGGVVLSGLALTCAIVSLVKLRKSSTAISELEERGEDTDSLKALTNQMQTQSYVSLGVSVCALAFNLVAFVTIFSAVMTAMQTGDYSSVFEALNLTNPNEGSSANHSSGSSKSIWDK